MAQDQGRGQPHHVSHEHAHCSDNHRTFVAREVAYEFAKRSHSELAEATASRVSQSQEIGGPQRTRRRYCSWLHPIVKVTQTLVCTPNTVWYQDRLKSVLPGFVKPHISHETLRREISFRVEHVAITDNNSAAVAYQLCVSNDPAFSDGPKVVHLHLDCCEASAGF